MEPPEAHYDSPGKSGRDSRLRFGRCGVVVRVHSGLVGILSDHRGPQTQVPTIFQQEAWIRRHIRKFFWQRWHKPAGRKRKLRSLGLRGDLLKVAHSSKGAWHLAATGSLNTALSNAFLRCAGFLLPSDLAAARCR